MNQEVLTEVLKLSSFIQILALFVCVRSPL